jgi:two-component system OmpR family response regulator
MAEKNAPGGAQLTEIVLQLQKDLRDLRRSHEELALFVDKMSGGARPVQPVATVPPPPPPSAAAPAPAPAPAAKAVSGAGKSALVVDDDAATRDQAMKALSGLGFSASPAETGEAAMAAMAKQRPSVIVVEGSMGGALSGRDFVNYVKSTMEWIDIPILLHTRDAVPNHEIARTDYGADDFVIKQAGSAETLAKKALRLLS